MSGNITGKMITVSSIASPGPQNVTIDSDSIKPTMSSGFGRQLAIIPPSLNDLNLPPNPFKILVTMAEANPTAEIHDESYSLQSPDTSEPSLISTPLTKLSTIEGWETEHTTTDNNIFYSNDEPTRIYFSPSSTSSPPSPRKLKRKLSLGMSFPKRGGLSRHIVDSRSLNRRSYQACRQQTKNSRPKTSSTYIAKFPILVYKWYLVVTYQPHASICTSC